MERHALCALFLIVLLGSVCLQNGYASNEMENSTAVRTNEDRSSDINDVPKKPMGPDVFRQLLNQETLILMTLVKNVYSMTQEMASLKNSVMSLQKNVEHVANVSMEDITGLKLANKKLKNSSEVLTEINQKQNKTISKLIHDFTDMKNEQNLDAKEMRYMDDQLLGNTSAALSELKTNFHVLSLSLLTIDKQSQEFQKRLNEVDVSLPQTINEKFNIVSESIKNISNQLSDDSLQTSKSELEESNQSYIKLSAAILSLKWFMNNISRKCDIQKRIGFTAGMNSTSSSWSSGKLIFNKVLFNQGSGYNLTSGVFTAPSSGVYVFYVSITSYDDNDIKVDITLNGTPLATAMGNGQRESLWGMGFDSVYIPDQMGTNMAVSSLKVGDKVWVQYKSGNGYSSNNVPVTTFAGFVI